MDWVSPMSIEDMMIISFRGLGSSIKGKTLWQIASLYRGLCVRRETLGFLRKSGYWKGCCGICFTSTPFFGPPVLPRLEKFHLMLFNSIDFWFVIQNFLIDGECLCV